MASTMFPHEPSKTPVILVINDLRMKLSFSGVRFVLVSFQYADDRKPQRFRYTTVCKIELHSQSNERV